MPFINHHNFEAVESLLKSGYEIISDNDSGVVIKIVGSFSACLFLADWDESPVLNSTENQGQSSSTAVFIERSVSLASARSGVIHNIFIRGEVSGAFLVGFFNA